MTIRRFIPVVFTTVILCAVGCNRSEPFVEIPPVAVVAAAKYPVRTDLMAVADLGAPPKWYSAGYPPLRSVRLGDRSPDPEFTTRLRPLLGKAILDPEAGLTSIQRDDIGRFLETYFGTPAAPTVHIVTKKQAEKVKLEEVFSEGLPKGKTAQDMVAAALADGEAAKVALQLDDTSLTRGSVLYRRWCLQCHGPTGGGDGAHAIAMNAMPRDYRQGIYKFITAYPTSEQPKKGEKGKPRKHDLKHVIRLGIDGSMMPSFPQFTDTELDDLAAYVIHLSIRGETEYDVLTRVISMITNPRDDDPLYSPEFAEQLVAHKFLSVLANWHTAAESPIPIPPENCTTELDRVASAVRGFKAFSNGGCLGCHANYGRDQQLKYDLWGTVVQPRNLLLGVYRGGRKGEDLYARVYGGIYPSTMPDYKAKLATTTPIPGRSDEVWDIVHFLQALSDPAGRRKMHQMDHNIKIEP